MRAELAALLCATWTIAACAAELRGGSPWDKPPYAGLPQWRPNGDVPIEIDIDNRMSGIFRLQRLVLTIDGSLLYSAEDASGALADQTHVRAPDTFTAIGRHRIEIGALFRGHGDRPTAWIDGYMFDVRSFHDIEAVQRAPVRVSMVVHERGGPNTPLEARPMVEWQVAGEIPGGQAAAPGPAASSSP